MLALIGAGQWARSQNFSVNGLKYDVLPDRSQSVEVSGADSAATNITVPETVEYQGKSYTVTAIADHAFDGRKSIRSVQLPATVERIGARAFQQCVTMTRVNIPAGLTEMGEGAFYWCTGLTSLKLPEGLTEIPPFAFYWCTALSNVNIPASVTTIGRTAFAAVPFTTLDIPEGVTEIGAYSFMFCDKIRTLNIPSTVTAIGDHAFSDTKILREINCAVSQPFECWPDFRSYTVNNAKVYVPIGTADAYKAVMPWSMFAHIIEKEFPNSGGTASVCNDVTCDDPADPSAAVQVYTLNGSYAGASLDNLQPGMYIVRTGSQVKKVII